MGCIKLVFMGQKRPSKMACLGQHARVVTRRHVVVIGAIVDRPLPVDRLDPFDRAQGFGATVTAVEDDV